VQFPDHHISSKIAFYLIYPQVVYIIFCVNTVQD
jgi:hypothetical protein